MAVTEHEGVAVHYEVAGPSDRPLVAFVGDVGYGPWLWGWQAPALTGPWRTLVWDLPGTGESDPPPADCDVEFLVDALETVLADVDVRRTHLVGAGLGGAVALAYAHEYGRARSLTCFGTPPRGRDVDEGALRALAMDPEDPASCERSLDGALTPAFREARPDLLEQICDWRRAEDAVEVDFDRQAGALLDFGGVAHHELTLPVLVCHGEDDPVVPPAAGRELARDLPRGRFEPVVGRHCCFVEHSRPVTDRLVGFLETVADEGDA